MKRFVAFTQPRPISEVRNVWSDRPESGAFRPFGSPTLKEMRVDRVRVASPGQGQLRVKRRSHCR